MTDAPRRGSAPGSDTRRCSISDSTPPNEVAGCSQEREWIREAGKGTSRTYDKELETMREILRIHLLLEQYREARRTTLHLLPLAEQLARIALQRRVPHRLDDAAGAIEVGPGLSARERREPLREGGGGAGLLHYADREGAQRAQEEPRVERADVGACVGARVPAASWVVRNEIGKGREKRRTA